MQIPALVNDRNARIGDNWRKRYVKVSLQRFTKRGLLLDDGSQVHADVVIFA